MSASTSRRWMSPPTAGNATTPRSQRIRSTRTMVQSMACTSFYSCGTQSSCHAGTPGVLAGLYRAAVHKGGRARFGIAFAAVLVALLAIDIDVRVELLGHLYADAASAPSAPVTLVLGAEVYTDGRPSPALQSRLDVAIALLASGRTKTLLMSGGNGTFETDAMRTYAIAH